MKKHLLYTLLIMSMAPLAVFAQEEEAPVKAPARTVAAPVPTHPVSGKVIDAATGQPAVGISVKAYGTGRYAAMTDENGEYTIKVPDWVTSLTFSAEGYTLVQQAIGKDGKVLPVTMYSDKFTAIYSTATSAKSSHTALVSYNNNDFSIDNQLQSQLGGDLHAITRNGIAGQGVMMLMNGINSLNSNAQPLVIVDGVMMNMQYNGSSLHDGFFNNVLSNIMVEDIEKISVLKNGTAIYGAKGANGVVLIETKRNKSMATKIDVSIGGTYEFLPKLPEMMNSEQFRVYASELIGTTGTKSNSFKFLQTDPNYYYYKQYHNSTDWSKEVYDEAFSQNYSINVQGGDDIANYNLSVGYALGDATLKNNSFSRFNLRLNTDIILARGLNVRFDAAYSDVTRNMRDMAIKENVTDGVISAPSFLALIKSPFLSPYAYDVTGNRSDYLAEADDYLADVVSRKGITTSLANPKSILLNGEGKNKNDFGNRTISLAVTPKWEINRDWTLADHFAFHINNTDQNYYLPTNGVPNYKVEGLEDYVENVASSLSGRQVTLMNDLYGQYQHRFNAHWVNVRGGFRYLHDTFRQDMQVGYDTGNDKTPNMNGDLNYKKTSGFDNNDVDLTYYLTGDYNYKERYYLSAAISMDGSSKFGVDADGGMKIGNYAFGFFPSVQGAWVISNEDWFKKNNTLNYLKLNAGLDIVGNDDINTRASRTYFVAGKIFNNITGKTIGNIGNTKLKWETTTRFTAGIQLAAIKNRLSVGFNYFNSTTNNLLCLNRLSYLTGVQTNWSNDGKLHNEGFDVNANARIVNTKDWTWSIGASLGHYKNEIKRLPGGVQSMETDMFGGTIISKVGSAAGAFYGYKTQGVFTTAEEAQAAGLYQETRTGAKQYFTAGDMHFVDNGDKVINEKDMQIIGDPNPDIYGNINTQVTWKRLTLGLNFNYSVGNDIYNYQRSIIEGGSFFYNQSTALLNRWNHDGQHTDIPRATFLDDMGNSRFSDRWIEDGSYLKLKTVTLSYHIPVHSTYLQGVTVWAAANNLFTITKYLGSDPEFSQSNAVIGMGIDRGLLAPGRSFSLGMKINL